MFRRSTKKGNYAYTVARVKAKKSKLLGEEDYNKMLMMTVPEISRYISEVGYAKEMTDLAARLSGLDLLEHATYSNMAKVFSTILSASTGELNEAVSAYLRKWDIWNLKVILRGKSYGLDAESIREDLVPAGSLGAESLDTLISLDSNDDVMANLPKVAHITIPSDVIAAYQASKNLGEIEDFLDKFHYERMIASINPNTRPARLFLGYIRNEIDVKNFETILKLKFEGIYGERVLKYMISGGRHIDSKMLAQLANLETVEATLSEVSELGFYEDIKDSVDHTTLRDMMTGLKKYKMRRVEKFSSMYPLSIIPVLDYMIHKEVEVNNVRAIARGTESGLDKETIKGLLVI